MTESLLRSQPSGEESESGGHPSLQPRGSLLPSYAYGSVPDGLFPVHIKLPPSRSTSLESAKTDVRHQEASPLLGHGHDRWIEVGKETEPSYGQLLAQNRPYRLYILSYVLCQLGEWFTYVANVAVVESVAPGLAKTAVSILVSLYLLPNLLFAGVGGVLADSVDRRRTMMVLLWVEAVVVLFYLLAIRAATTDSSTDGSDEGVDEADLRPLIPLYLTAFVQCSVVAVFQPVRESIVPMMVPEDSGYLSKATTLSEMTWSFMAAMGSSLGGVAVPLIGVANCYRVVSGAYVVSACLMGRIGGRWSIAPDEGTPSEGTRGSSSVSVVSKLAPSSLWQTFASMMIGGVTYLRSSSFGGLVFMKSSAALACGAFDVLIVSFSERPNDADGNSIRLGLLYSFLGIGSLLGPLISERFTDMRYPRTLFVACIVGLGVLAAAYFCMAMPGNFGTVCLFTLVRSAGYSTLWTNSLLLLQKFSKMDMFGRVSAVDFALATLCEALSAYCAAFLQDMLDLTAQAVSLLLAVASVVICSVWAVIFHRGFLSEAIEASELALD